MIEPRQIRAARALLNWSQTDLAEASGVAVSSIKNIENSLTVARKETIEDISYALEKSGVEFMPGSGVRIKERLINVLNGPEGYWKLLDDVYDTLVKNGGEVCILGLDEAIVEKELQQSTASNPNRLAQHIERLRKANITERLIIKKGDKKIVAPASWYRCIEQEFFEPYPLYIYGEKIAILTWGPPFKAVVYDNPEIAKTLGKIFDFIWKHAEQI